MTRNQVILAFGATLVALALALPGVASAAPEFALTVNLAGEGEGEVECEIQSGGAEPCEAEYPAGTELTLVPIAEAGSEFAGFSAGAGSAAGCTGASPCTFTITANSSVTATFELEPLPEFALTVNKAGTGTGTVECEVQGALPALCAAKYPEGTELILIAKADPGSEFGHWSGACSFFEEFEECELTMEGPRSVTATFKLSPALTVKTAGTGSGTVECEAEEGPEPCAARYPKETELILHAKASPGSKFVKWSGCDSIAGDDCEVEMNTSRSVTVTFDLTGKPKFKLTVTKSGTGSGTVTSVAPNTGISCGATCSAEFEEGKEVELSQTASGGSEFKEWTGVCTGSGSCKVTMSAAKSVGAKFDTQSGGGGGSGGGSGGAGGGGSSSGDGGGSAGGGGAVPGTAKAAGTASVGGGKAALKLTCSGGACQGTLKLTAKVKQGKKTKNVVIGQASFSLAAGASSTLKVKLSGAAKQELGKGKTLKAKLSGTGITGSTVEIKPAKKKHNSP